MRKKYLPLFILMFTLLISFPILSKASEMEQGVDYETGNTPVVDLSVDDTMYEVESITTKAAPPLVLTYKITKKEVVGRGMDAFRNGPSGTGPATLGINQSDTINRTYTNTISGKFPIGKGEIAASLGVTIGEAKTYGTSYSIPVEAGKRKMIIYAPEYVLYEVTQRLYKNGIATDNYETAQVKVFESWYYDWKYVQ